MGALAELKEGLTSRTLLAMLFSSLVMMPALLWVYLSTGIAVGTIAAAYATMLIFGELGMIMMSPLSASELATIRWGASIAAGYGAGFIFSVYMRKSPITKQFGIAEFIPTWVVPPEDSPAVINRVIWHPDWYLPILISFLSMGMFLLASLSLSFIARELFLEVEKLPFPTGAVAAEIAISLSGGASERYRIFSVSTILTAAYEGVRVLLPAVGVVLFGRELMLINPLHFDFTLNIEPFLPGATFGVTTNPLVVGIGFIVPEIVVIWAVITTIAAYLVLPPILTRYAPGLYPYVPGRPMLMPGTILGAWYEPMLKFWLSIGVGLLLAAAIIPTLLGARQVATAFRSFFSLSGEAARRSGVLPGRVSLGIFVASMLAASFLAYALTPIGPHFLLAIILINLGYSFVNTIVGARSAGLTGGFYTIPYLNEVTFWLTTPQPSPSNVMSYWVWFNPFIGQALGGASMCIGYKAAQLTGTKPMSIAKAHILGVFMSSIVGLIVAGMLWYVYDVPSRFMPAPSYPADALLRSLFITRQFRGFFKADFILGGFAASTLFVLLPRLIPALSQFTGIGMVFGVISGLMDMPSNSYGILLGYIFKKLLERKMGREWSNKYMMTVAAGIWTGSSVIISLATSLRFIKEAISPTIY